MKFIDIEQRAPKGREFSDEPHRSTLIIYDDGLQVLGVIPHGSLIRPTTEAQRDAFVAHLQGLKYNRILDNSDYKAAFVDWASDHHAHFDCYPGSFIYSDDSGDEANDIEFTEQEIWGAIEILFLSEGET